MQALQSFSSALASGQLGSLMHQFGLDDSAVAAAQNGGVIFVENIINFVVCFRDKSNFFNNKRLAVVVGCIVFSVLAVVAF